MHSFISVFLLHFPTGLLCRSVSPSLQLSKVRVTLCVRVCICVNVCDSVYVLSTIIKSSREDLILILFLWSRGFTANFRTSQQGPAQDLEMCKGFQ